MNRPVIGICTPQTEASWGLWTLPAALLPLNYLHAIQAAGGMAVLIAPDPALIENPDEILDHLDGLILAGGNDMDPECYGAERHPATADLVPLRDRTEIALARRAIQRDLPLLGICRGMQVINVALGGTLLQHVPDVVGHDEHRRVPGSFTGADHDVRLQPGSLAARSAGEEHHGTKSHHHQAVDTIGEGLTVTGHSDDGRDRGDDRDPGPAVRARRPVASRGGRAQPGDCLTGERGSRRAERRRRSGRRLAGAQRTAIGSS